jgi:hypothetical protein
MTRKPNLKAKLHQKIREKKWERTSRVCRDARLDKLEEKLDKCVSTKEERELRREIAMLKNIEEKELDANDDFPQYTDNGCYGGGLEHPD